MDTLNAVNLGHGGAMNALKALNTLNAVNLEHGGAMNGCSECCEFGTWWCYEWML